jgi:hypothetical protein
MRSSHKPGVKPMLSTAVIVTVLASTSQLGGCTSAVKRDFYAIRSVRIGSTAGDATVIVRANPSGLLTRERRAMALAPSE